LPVSTIFRIEAMNTMIRQLPQLAPIFKVLLPPSTGAVA
jgi:hypothetical protein